MCVIYGDITNDSSFLKEQAKKATTRGKDETITSFKDWKLVHWRTPTNQSKDTYPIKIDDSLFAMNGIIFDNFYNQLIQEYKDKNVDLGYSVDSAYMLKKLIDAQLDWSQFDNLNCTFAFWMVHDGELYLGNKDFPLYLGENKFSSFNFEDSKKAGNKVYKYQDGNWVELYSFTHLIYNGNN